MVLTTDILLADCVACAGRVSHRMAAAVTVPDRGDCGARSPGVFARFVPPPGAHFARAKCNLVGAARK